MKARRIYGWIFVRPRRWFFGRMGAAAYPQWFPRKEEFWGWTFPNIHWWLLYRTVFKFFKWLYWDAWRPLCKWGKYGLADKPWYARAVHRIGTTTVGYAIHGHILECFHCASPDGNPVDLAKDETGKTFRFRMAWTVGTQEGTDHRFCGTTICPKCGYEEDYEDGSL